MTEDCRDSLEIKIARLEERLVASDKALELARTALTHWQESSNEWRKENIDVRSQFMTIDKANALIAVEGSLRGALEGRVRVLEDSVKLDTGKHTAFNTTWVVVAFIVTSGIDILYLVMRAK